MVEKGTDYPALRRYWRLRLHRRRLVRAEQYLELLSRLAFQESVETLDRPFEPGKAEGVLEPVSSLGSSELADFLQLAQNHHVLVRALSFLEESESPDGDVRVRAWCAASLEKERARIEHAVATLRDVCSALESHGCDVVVIKSLDHWPDLGSDLDLYTTADAGWVRHVMQREFGAETVARSWGDRLANKWNFKIAHLPELIEIHVLYLGQTGEHQTLARRVIGRRTTKTVNGHTLWVPAPEERVILWTLQRMYRHFYFRLCDMLDATSLLEERAVDFQELRRATEAAGIWSGVAAFLLLVSRYAAPYGRSVQLPGDICSSTRSTRTRSWFEDGFFRISKLSAVGLYGSQFLRAGLNRDWRAVRRLPLLPPLAVSALLAYHLTGSDKGVW
jgi:hypothetical protein